jgi:formylglycine-generating enzyme required for sulfatase activity
VVVTPAAGATRTNSTDGAVYVFVPAGEFERGASDGAADEQPVQTIFVDAFWIMRTEVTNAQYRQCVDAGACSPPHNQFWQNNEMAEYPVVDVDWEQALAYATWAGGRLPTEAEWEKAARGSDGRQYPWGDQEPSNELLNYRFQESGPTPVGRYPDGVSPFGLLDMAGNAEEWVADWYAAEYYAAAPSQNPPGPEAGIMRVIRGGSYNSNPLGVRATAREKAFPTGYFPSVGFRVVSSLP